MLKDEKDRFYDTMFISLDGNNKPQTIKRYMRVNTIKECVDRILTMVLRPFMASSKYVNNELNHVLKQWILKSLKNSPRMVEKEKEKRMNAAPTVAYAKFQKEQ